MATRGVEEISIFPDSTVLMAITAAISPSAAHNESAICAFSRTSRPSIQEIPLKRVASQPATAPALTNIPTTNSHPRGRNIAITPHATWATVTKIKIRASCGCSACSPIAPPCMSPAPIEAIAAYINPAYPIVVLCVSSILSMIIPCNLFAEYGDNRYLFGGKQ